MGPLELSFVGMDTPEWAEADIRRRVDKLHQRYEPMVGCRVRVSRPTKLTKGNPYEVTIELSIPGEDIVVSKEPHHLREKYADPDLRTIIRDSFKAAERMLKERKRMLGGEVKTHDAAFLGQVTQLYPNDDHGFLLTNTGTQLYFHRNSVLNNEFDNLQKGTPVNYVETVGDTGPIASKVRIANPAGQNIFDEDDDEDEEEGEYGENDTAIKVAQRGTAQ